MAGRSDYGAIVDTIHDGPLGHEWVSFQWQGGPLIAVSDRTLTRYGGVYVSQVGDRITIGPYQLRIIDYQPWMRSYLCHRDGVRALAYVQWYRLSRCAEVVYRRVIITLAVWGLADYQRELVPSWRDIR